MAVEDMLTVSKVNICESLEQANQWGVRTVPTTFVLDKDGTVQHVNNGLVTEKVLVEQINADRRYNGLIHYSANTTGTGNNHEDHPVNRPQRSLPLRQWEKVQKVLYGKR